MRRVVIALQTDIFSVVQCALLTSVSRSSAGYRGRPRSQPPVRKGCRDLDLCTQPTNGNEGVNHTENTGQLGSNTLTVRWSCYEASRLNIFSDMSDDELLSDWLL